MLAASSVNTEIVKLLLDKGADVNLKNKNNETAKIVAEKRGHTEIARLLN